jgi:hypothetical protein
MQAINTGYVRLSPNILGVNKEPTIMVECTEADVRTLLNDTLTKLRDMAAGMLQGTKPRRADGFDKMARYLEEARTLTHRLREFRPKKPEDAQ